MEPPIHSLPPELLEEVFIRAYPHVGVDITRLTSSHEASLNIWNLNGVCSRWRAVTLSFPELWSDIHIYTDRLSNTFKWNTSLAQRIVSLLNICFVRSSTRGVSVSLHKDQTEDNNNTIPFIHTAILPILHRNRQRVSSLNIQINFSFLLSSLDDELKRGRGLTAIKSLTLSGWQPVDTDQMHNFASSLSHLSVLKILDIKGGDSDAFDWHFPWSQLTTFEWKGYPLPLNSYNGS
ncbi:hypothetical protein BDQ17DRAFT_1425829 [Cyathus striatus]|nr:hypothetical protein BDQ17DRAFT_1425829 [Cyathus striatus]